MNDQKMSSELSKNDVLNLLRIWNVWMNGPNPGNNKPDEFKWWDNTIPNGMKFAFGIVLHLFLWFMTMIGLWLNVTKLAIWASKASVKYDYLWWEPVSCGLNNAYTYLGIGYLRAGKIKDTIECLKRSSRVYPCPHNTSYGLKLNLYNKLKNHPEAKVATAQYLDMWERFKRA
jgi:hypothetical protein